MILTLPILVPFPVASLPVGGRVRSGSPPKVQPETDPVNPHSSSPILPGRYANPRTGILVEGWLSPQHNLVSVVTVMTHSCLQQRATPLLRKQEPDGEELVESYEAGNSQARSRGKEPSRYEDTYPARGERAIRQGDLETPEARSDRAADHRKQAVPPAPNNYTEAQNRSKVTGRFAD